MIKPILIIMILSIFNLIAISDTQQTVYAEKDVDEQTQQEDAYCDDADDEKVMDECGNTTPESRVSDEIKKLAEEVSKGEPVEGLAATPIELSEEDEEELEENEEEENKELDKGVEVSEEPEQEEEFETNNEEEEEEQEEESEPEDEEGEE
jgi:hypothetical protein